MPEQQAVQTFLDTIETEYPKFREHFPLIQKACDFALHAHAGQIRRYSGKPFITHPIDVALICAERFDDIDLLIASILHDCAEDNENISIESIYQQFGETIGFIVDAVTDTTNFFVREPEYILNDRIEKFLYGGTKDIRCILLKLHDREHNITTLAWLEPHKQIRMSFETQAIYEPLKKLFWLRSQKNSSIDIYTELLQHYISANRITSPHEFKETLLSQTFFDFDNDTFKLVYNNSDRIFREINNKEVFEKLIERKCFDEKIDIISFQQDTTWDFLVVFKYKKWEVLKDLIVNSKYVPIMDKSSILYFTILSLLYEQPNI
jgi:hypothetical protein